VTSTGPVLYGTAEQAGPLADVIRQSPNTAAEVAEELRELASNLAPLLAIMLVLGVAWSSRKHRENLVGAMITGYRRPDHDSAGR